MRFRFVITLSAIFISFAALLLNLYDLQINEGKFYSARAEWQFRLTGNLEPRRGIIYLTDKNGNVIHVSLNREFPVVFAIPKEIGDEKETAQIVSEILGLKPEILEKKFSLKKSNYERLAVKADDEVIDKIKSASLKGIYVNSQEFRFYPFAGLASHVLGFVGLSDKDSEVKGRYGLEAYFDDALRGKEGFVKGEKITAAVHGNDLYLTLDRNIQAQAEQILAETIQKNKAQGGSVIVQEPKTGKILAFANNPSFDPNNYGKSELDVFLNSGIQSLYEPGSVFKVMTLSAGIDSGKITPETEFFDTGSVTLNGKKITNYEDKVYGKVTMTNVIEKSINTGSVFAEKKTSHKDFYDYLVKFGFTEKTGVKLPGEVKGDLSSLVKDPRDINFATASFGQGIAVTPLELINAVSAIANGGLLMKPLLLKDEKPEVVRRVIKPETARQVSNMMTSAVGKAGIAAIPDYNVAGKTGTAQIPDLKRGGYKEEFIHTFSGFAPATDPRFTILFKIDKPSGGEPAAVTVVPAFRELAQFILNYYNIAPDNLYEKSY